MAALKEIEIEALGLSPSDRGRLIRNLLQLIALSGAPTDDYEAELSARIGKIRAGTAVALKAETVFSNIEKTIARP